MDAWTHNPWALQEHFFLRLQLIKARGLTPAETDHLHTRLLAEIDLRIAEAIVEGDEMAERAYEQAREYVRAKI